MAFLTGLCGLGSETLFFKLLDYTIGSAPLVSFAVVATFILGMGVGALLSPKVRLPWIVEISLCFYNLVWLFFHPMILQLNGSLLGYLVPVLGANPACVGLALLYLAPPSVLLGITFPAVVERRKSVAWPYFWQSLGAVSGVVSIEALVFPFFGLDAAIAVLAVAHLLAALLFFSKEFHLGSLKLGRLAPLLIFTGVATGAYQGIWLFLAGLLFEPYYFVQPTVVATMLTGIFLGSLLWLRVRPDFDQTLVALLAGMGISAGLVSVWTRIPGDHGLWSGVYQIPLILLPSAIPIGALFPAFFLERSATRTHAGSALLSLSIGNALGILLAGPLLLSYLPSMLGIFAITCLLFGILLRHGRRFSLAGIVAPVALIFALWTGEADFIRRLPGHGDLVISIEETFRGPGEISAIYSYPLTGEGLATQSPSRKLLERSLEIDPNTIAVYRLGIYYYQTGQYEEALEQLTRYLELDPTVSDAYVLTYLTLVRMKESERAVEVLEQGLNYFERNLERYKPYHDDDVDDPYNEKAVAVHARYKRSIRLLSDLIERSRRSDAPQDQPDGP